jgi:hypothetical protein
MISGARRPRARCAVSNRRLAEATAACKARSAAHRTTVGGVGSAIGDGALVAKDRAHGRAPWLGLSVRYFKKATVPGRAWEWAAQSICEWARRSVREWAKLPSPARRQKRQRRSPCDASRQIYFIAWVVCAREIDDLNVFGCDQSGRGIDFLAASGFNDVSSTGILTYS